MEVNIPTRRIPLRLASDLVEMEIGVEGEDQKMFTRPEDAAIAARMLRFAKVLEFPLPLMNKEVNIYTLALYPPERKWPAKGFHDTSQGPPGNNLSGHKSGIRARYMRMADSTTGGRRGGPQRWAESGH